MLSNTKSRYAGKNLSLLFIAFLLLQSSTLAQTEYWEFRGLANTQINQIAITADEQLFARSASQIFYSSDYGVTWEDRTNNLPGDLVLKILIDSVSSVSPRVLVIVRNTNNYVFGSLNNGESWTLFDLPNNFNPGWMGINSYGHLYFYDGSDLIKTTDNGLTWISKQLSWGDNGVNLKFLDYDNLVGTGYWDDIGMRYTMVIKSTNDGDSFFSIGGGSTVRPLRAVETGLDGDIFYWIDPWSSEEPYIVRHRIEHPNEIYANRKFWDVAVNKYDFIFFSFNNDFFYTTDNGSSWVDSLSGIIPSIQALDITKYGYLVAGTESGIYITKKSTMPSHYPFHLNFDEVMLGTPLEKQLSLINNTKFTVTIDSLSLSSSVYSYPHFSPVTLEPFDSVIVNITFFSSVYGEFLEWMWIYSQNYIDSVSLFASCPYPEIEVLPENYIHFGYQYIGTTITKSIQLKNISINTLQIDSLTLFSTQFEFSSSNFPIVLEEGETTLVDVTFTPTIFGNHIDTLYIHCNGIGELEVHLIGQAANPISVSEIENKIPKNFLLRQNFPNPFNPLTTIFYGLPNESSVEIIIYDVLGNRVMRIAQDNQPAGYHSIKFDGSTLPSGIYFYKLQAGSFVETKKMLLLK